jgi:N-acetylmuramoyl-L-alanine amidase
MGAYLIDNRPARSQYRCPRRRRPSGVVVVHTAENTPDFVAFDGAAESVARFIRTRATAGSYHDIVDSDSALNLVPYDCEAFQDGTGSNSHAYGISMATRADVWPLAPKAWRDGAIRQAAAAARRYANWLRSSHGVEIPARRINREQSERGVPGFISHAERDPSRRTDPGAAFPWTQFLQLYAGAGIGEEDIDVSPDELKKIVREAVQAELTTGGDESRTALFELAGRAVSDRLGYYGRREGQGDVCFILAAVVKVPVTPGVREWNDTLRKLTGLGPAKVVDVPAATWDGLAEF